MAAADVALSSILFSHDPSAVDPPVSRAGPGAGTGPVRDDLDDLFNYDAQTDEVLHNVEDNADTTAVNARKRRLGSEEGDLLGIDEEIKIRKARAPIAKLDEDRLLSQNGIPKLRRIAKERLKLRGKGHEFSDVQRLLNTYQLWLDDLFPKAKFADGLAIVEKLGHKRRLTVMRQEWINEGKPKPVIHDSSDEDEPGEGRGEQNDFVVVDDDEELDDETLYGRPAVPVRQAASEEQAQRDDAGPEEDELDLLLAEDASRSANPVMDPGMEDGPPAEDDFADDEEAMAGMW